MAALDVGLILVFRGIAEGINGIEISGANARMKTMGGEIWWDNLRAHNGVRLQQNKVTNHCRILDADDYRIAWGTESGMKRLWREWEESGYIDEV